MNDNNNNSTNNGTGIILAFFTGCMAGAVIGLLYAPSSGKKTREKLREVSIDAKNRAAEFSQQTIDNVGKSIQNLAGQTEQTIDNVGKSIQNLVGQTEKETSEEETEEA